MFAQKKIVGHRALKTQVLVRLVGTKAVLHEPRLARTGGGPCAETGFSRLHVCSTNCILFLQLFLSWSGVAASISCLTLYPLLVELFFHPSHPPHMNIGVIYRYISRLPIFNCFGVSPARTTVLCSCDNTLVLPDLLLLLGPVDSLIHAGQPHLLFCSMYYPIHMSTCLLDLLSCRSVLLSLLVSMRFPPILDRDG